MAKVEVVLVAETLEEIFKDRAPEAIVRMRETCDCPACIWWRERENEDPEAS
jgi:hypothetical protein